jgi:hypothetical protein
MQRVKLFFKRPVPCFTTTTWFLHRFFNQGLLEIFQSKSAQKFSIRVRLKNENQGSIDPDRFFNRDRDRA